MPKGDSGPLKLECSKESLDPKVPKINIELGESTELTFTKPPLFGGKPQVGAKAKISVSLGGLTPNVRDSLECKVTYKAGEQETYTYTVSRAVSTLH